MGFERSQINQILTLLGVLYGAELPAMPCSPDKCRAAPKVHRRGVVTRGLAMRGLWRLVTIFFVRGYRDSYRPLSLGPFPLGM